MKNNVSELLNPPTKFITENGATDGSMGKGTGAKALSIRHDLY